MALEKKEWPIIGMTLEEAADALRINKRTLMNLIRDTDFPARKVGGKAWRILPAAVERWLDGRDPNATMCDNDE